MRPLRELLDEPVVIYANMGSFDCIVARSASDDSAQDDRVIESSR
jgi:hypothetical protein